MKSLMDFYNGIFSYQRIEDPRQVSILQSVWEYARKYTEYLTTHCPNTPERSMAIVKLRECVMWANASIACQNVYKTIKEEVLRGEN